MVSEKDFPELPILVIHDTVISDVLGEKKTTPYKESAIFITNYFLIRQALIGMDSEKSGITTSRVFKAFEPLLKDKNTFEVIKDWIDETTFTESLNLNEKSSVYIYSHFIARRFLMRTGRRVILICNDDNVIEKLIKFYNDSAYIGVKSREDIPFAVMNTDELKRRLKEEMDKDIFDIISDYI